MPCVRFEPCNHVITCAECCPVALKKCMECKAIIQKRINMETNREIGPQSDYNDLRAQLNVLKEEKLCVVCAENEKKMVFNCGHSACISCSSKLAHCHICRAAISNKVKLF